MAPSRPARPTFEFKDAKLSPPRSPWRRAQVRARQQFLDTVHRLQPAVLASLKGAPAEALREVPTTSLDQGESLSWKRVTSLAATNDAACRLRDTLRLWGRGWRLDADWVYQRALFQLLTWFEDETVDKARTQKWFKLPPIDHNDVLMFQAALFKRPSVARSTRLQITYPGWDPLRVPPGRYRQEAITAFKKVLTEYTKDHAETYTSQPKTPQPTLDAAVRFQVLAWSYDRIARVREPGLDPGRLLVRRRDLRRTIKEFLSFIELSARPTRSGGSQKKAATR